MAVAPAGRRRARRALAGSAGSADRIGQDGRARRCALSPGSRWWSPGAAADRHGRGPQDGRGPRLRPCGADRPGAHPVGRSHRPGRRHETARAHRRRRAADRRPASRGHAARRWLGATPRSAAGRPCDRRPGGLAPPVSGLRSERGHAPRSRRAAGLRCPAPARRGPSLAAVSRNADGVEALPGVEPGGPA